MTESAMMSQRHNLIFLRCIVDKSVLLRTGRTPDWDTIGVLSDYFTWLAVDALTDGELACRLVPTLAKLQDELHAEAKNRRAQDTDPITPAFYEGFLHGLEQVISFRHGIDFLLDEEISRKEFLESWERTRERLGP